MKFVSNTGKMKQVKYTSGIVMGIPEGSSSQLDDPNLDKIVNSSSELSYVSQEEFYKQNDITPTKEKIETAKKDKKPLKPPAGKGKKATEEKIEKKTEPTSDE